MSTNTNQNKKYLSVITYCIALVCLLLGLFLPIFDGKNLLFMMLPDAFCTAFGINVENMVGDMFTRFYPIVFVGTSHEVDFMALTVSLYAVITLIGLILLIPVLASKSTGKTASVCAYIVEIAAAVVLVIYAVLEIELYITAMATDAFNWDYGVIGIALGGTLLMLIIQSVGNKKGSGAAKLILALLGAAGVLCLFYLPVLFGLDKYTLFSDKLYISFTSESDAISYMTIILCNGLNGIEGLKYQILMVALCAAALITIINFIFDILQLGTNAKKSSHVFDVIRYVVQALILILCIIMVLVVNIQGFYPGLLMYALLLITIIQLAISSVRCGKSRKVAAAAKIASINNAPAADLYYDDTATLAAAPAPAAYQQPVFVSPAPAPAPVVAQEPAPEPAKEIVYTAREIYRGPTDSFMARLTDSEKIEFAKLFLEKINGPFANIPDYVIGGDNKEFFSSIFIYLGKFRSLLSDGLMNKIYNELNLLN